MENQTLLLETLFEKTECYARTSAELLKLKTIDKSADALSILTARIVIILVLILFFLTLNIGIALLIGENLGRLYYGFFIVAGFYAICGIMLHIFRDKWLQLPLRNSIITHLLK